MAPSAKRKRGDRTYSHDSHDGSNRPSPHRPESLGLAQQGRSQGQHSHQHGQGPQGATYSHQQSGRGGRRFQRGGMRSTGNQSQQGHAPNGESNTETHNTKRPNAGSQDQASNAQPANAPPSTDAVMSPPSNPPQKPNPTPTPSQQQNQAPTAPPQTQPSAPPAPPKPYDHKIVTDDRLKSWNEDGRAAVADVVNQAGQSQDSIALSTVFQQLLRAGLDGRIDAAEAGKLAAEALAPDQPEANFYPSEIFLDTLSTLTESEPSHPRIKPLVLATGISPTLMREVLEVPLLQNLGLIRPTFYGMFVRKQTNILYKQSNYNLLREETEGYSKLVTELFTITNSEPPTAEVVDDTFENIKALIGAFDLDAGRVLDVTLDVFASLLVKHYRFFVKLLRTSSWWPHDQSYGLPTEVQGFGSLPPWAQPDHSSWLATEEEKEEIAQLKLQRDQQFWERARRVGMDAFFELGGRRIVGDHDLEVLVHAAMPHNPGDVRVEETRKWVKATKTLPPPGNSVAAQLLGFKLRFYASSARDAHDALPVNLIYLAALLIKIGFISLRDLYPHLFPEDESMSGVKEKMMKEKEEREMAKRPGGGTLNALARAGALADDTLPPQAAVGRLREPATRASTPSKMDAPASKSESTAAKPEEEEKELLPEPSDQKVQLLRSLLCIGAIPESLYLLGRFTWLPDAFPDLPDHIHRLLHYSLQKVYEPLRPLQQRDGIREAARVPSTDQAGVGKGELRLQEPPPAKTLRWAQLDKNDTNEGIDYRFYWDDWSDNVPICQNVDDVFTLCGTLMNLSGVKIGQDSALLVKLARIGKHSLTQDFSQANQTRWIDLSKRLLAPALSLTKANPGVVNEVYDLLKLLPTPTRYSIYNEWFLGPTSRLPDLEDAFDLARAETKDTLRRMTKTNQRLMARNLAKVACGSPGIVFQVVFGQIESYQNLIDVVVECARYFTYMGYDILTWALLSSLGKAGRSRVSERNGINVSQWLASLSKFSGKVSKRYSIMNPLPILQYVLEQLCQDNFADLQVLRELISNMAGIAPDTDFTDAQVQAMAGGELLQGQILQQLQDKRHESKAAGKRLMKTIVDHDLTGSLLVAIAQQRQRCMFNDNNTQLKIIGENYDSVHIVFTQYLDMLRHNLFVKEFDQLVPDIYSLISDFGIEPSIAFMIHRKSIVKAMEEYDAAHPPAKKQTIGDAPSVNGIIEKAEVLPTTVETPAAKAIEDVEMSETLEVEPKIQEITEPITTGVHDANEAPADGSTNLSAKLPQAAEVGSLVDTNSITAKQGILHTDQSTFKWHPVIQEIMDKIKGVLPADFENSMSLPFFVSFWQLSLNDLTLPTQSYNEEISRQKDQLAAINADRSDVSTTGVQRKEKDKKAVNEFLSRLTEEMKASVSKHSHVRQRLDKEKQHWFQDVPGKGKPLANALIQDCFLPRMLMSPLDSQYSWRMFNMLHSSGTPWFRTILVLDRLFDEKVFSNLMFHCTGRETENFGRFLNELFRELGVWHSSRAEYEKRAFGPKKTLPGFAEKITRDGKIESLLDYEGFRTILHKWHVYVYKALTSALKNDEYMHIKNACVILRAVVRHYPVVNWMGTGLLKILQGISTTEENKDKETRRDDIWVLSTSVLGNLKARQKHWMLPQAFHLNKQTLKAQNSQSREQSTGPKSPLPEAATPSKSLNAEAAPFEPKDQAADGDQKISISVTTEVEDGELEDIVMSDSKATEDVQQELKDEDINASDQSSSTPQVTQETKKDQKAEMRAKVQASADAKRRRSQLAAADARPSAADLNSANATSPAQSTASNPVPQATGAAALPSNEDRSTPSAGAQIPTRPELNRGHSTPGPPERPSHALPNRPDMQASQRNRYSQRYSENVAAGVPDRPDSRGRSFQDTQRSDRPGDNMPQRHVDRSGAPNSRADNLAGYQRGDTSTRYPDPGPPDDRGFRQGQSEFGGRPTPREARPGGRELMDSRPASGRGERMEQPQGPNSRHEAYGPAQNQAPPPTSAEMDYAINPERAARIHHGEGAGRPNNYGRQTDGLHGHDGGRGSRSRPQSPSRGESRLNEPRRDQSRQDHARPTAHDREVAPEHAPNGPRGGPPPRHGAYTPDGHSRSDLMQPPPSRAPNDRNSGRFPQDFTSRAPPRYRDDNYGRLNTEPPGTPQSPQVSSPPNDQGSRNVNGGPIPPSRRQNEMQPPANERTLASGANTDQRSHRQPVSSAPATPTPAAESPSRDLTGIHPSRLEQFGQEPARVPPIQGGGASQNQAPPAGPRSAEARRAEAPTSATAAPSPAPHNAPAGPANAAERRNRDGSARRQFAEVQQTLSQSGQTTAPGPGVGPSPRNNSVEQGTSIRGRATAGRQQQQSGPSVAESSLESRIMQNGHSDAPDQARDATLSQQQSQPPPRDRPEREAAGMRSSGTAGRERSPQRDREDPAAPPARSHRSSREQSRDNTRGSAPTDRERERDRAKDHGRAMRGSGPAPERDTREREHREPAGGRPGASGSYDTRQRGAAGGGEERERDRDRERQPYPTRSGGPSWSGSGGEAPAGPPNTGRRGDGRERREPPPDARKRGWGPDEGAGGMAKRQRRGGE